MDRILGGKTLMALPFEGDVDKHDAVLLHDADQQDNADYPNYIERAADQHEGEQRAETSRRQRRQNRQRMDRALIEHAKNDIDRKQCREDQRGRGAERALEGLRVALEARGDRGWQVKIGGRLLHR